MVPDPLPQEMGRRTNVFKIKAGNFSFQPRTAKKLLLIGKNGTNLEPGGSQEAPGTAQSSIHPLIAVLELILGSLTVASGNLTE